MTRSWASVAELVDAAIGAGEFPSAALLIGSGDDVVYELYAGAPAGQGSETTNADTVYDLSSLTKPLATVAALMRLVDRGVVAVDRAVAAYVPDFAGADSRRAAITVAHLLAHCSGLPAHRRYFETICHGTRAKTRVEPGTKAAADAIETLAMGEPLERAPGDQAVYSDVGFIVLGRIIENVAGSLDALFREEIAQPLALRSSGFVDLESSRPAFAERAAPSGGCEWRRRRIRGEVQDENAWAMGGVAGHAGLFSTAREVHLMVAEQVRSRRGRAGAFSAATVERFWTRDVHTPGSTWALGWDTPSPSESSAGTRIGRPAVGHLGFTGTSVWIDLARGVHVVFLTNRLEAGRDNARIRALRPRLHDAVFRAVDEELR